MTTRPYRLGRRQEAVDRTRAAILAAARDLVASGNGPEVSAGAVARRAGVSRITLYNHFGSKAGVLAELAAAARPQTLIGSAAKPDDPRGELDRRIADSCLFWSSDPALFRHLPTVPDQEDRSSSEHRALALRLAESGQLRAGCSLKEAEDVIGALTSFGVFNRLHKDGRRSSAAVAEILMRLAAGILTQI
jgi:AcrR family transcriptional regulator